MGLNLMPLRVPDFPIDILSLTVEAAVFFDELTRFGTRPTADRENQGRSLSLGAPDSRGGSPRRSAYARS